MEAGVFSRRIRKLKKMGLACPVANPSGDIKTRTTLSKSSPPWSRRYMLALDRYEGLDICSQRAVDAVIEGLLEWAAMVPQRATKPDGEPAPVNKWGLGAERAVIRAIRPHLILIGKESIAARIGAELADLMETVEALDACYLEIPFDPEAEIRLGRTARIQTRALARLLADIHFDDDKPDHSGRRNNRGAPRRHYPEQDKQLLDEWANTRGMGGMNRKEFCAARNITLQTFIRAQDRLRKYQALHGNRELQQSLKMF